MQGVGTAILSGNKKWVFGILGGLAYVAYGIVCDGARTWQSMVRYFLNGYSYGILSKTVGNLIQRLPKWVTRKAEVVFFIETFTVLAGTRYFIW